MFERLREREYVRSRHARVTDLSGIARSDTVIIPVTDAGRGKIPVASGRLDSDGLIRVMALFQLTGAGMPEHDHHERRSSRGRRFTDLAVPAEVFRALVIDPHEDTRELLRYCFEAEGFAVETVADGQSGLEAAKERVPDLIVTEVGLPRIEDGFELLTALRADPLTKDIQVLVLTAHAHESTRARARQFGAADVLTKPIAPDDLLRAIGVLMETADPSLLVERQLRRKLLVVRRLARRYAGSPALRKLLGHFIDQLQQAVLLLDEEGHLLAASVAVEHVTGYTKAAIHERRVSDSVLGSEPVLAQWWERVRTTEHWSGDTTFARDDGRLLSARAVCMSAGIDGLHIVAFAPATLRASNGPPPPRQ